MTSVRCVVITVADARLEVRRHGVRRRRALLQRVRARLQRLRDESHVADTVADLLHRGPHGLLEGRGGGDARLHRLHGLLLLLDGRLLLLQHLLLTLHDAVHCLKGREHGRPRRVEHALHRVEHDPVLDLPHRRRHELLNVHLQEVRPFLFLVFVVRHRFECVL